MLQISVHLFVIPSDRIFKKAPGAYRVGLVQQSLLLECIFWVVIVFDYSVNQWWFIALGFRMESITELEIPVAHRGWSVCPSGTCTSQPESKSNHRGRYRIQKTPVKTKTQLGGNYRKTYLRSIPEGGGHDVPSFLPNWQYSIQKWSRVHAKINVFKNDPKTFRERLGNILGTILRAKSGDEKERISKNHDSIGNF